jgi:hypothetical protein
MKEKPIFEEVFTQLIRQPDFWLKVLIGGLLSFVPIVNFFAFGYLYRFSLQARRTGQLNLPEWNDWAGLFADGLKFAVVWLAYWLLPLLLALLVSSIFGGLGLAALSYLLLSSVFLISPVLFSSALYRLQMRSDFKDLLDVVLIIRMSYMEFSRFILPALVFLGICALALPIYGFALFAGFLLLIAHTGLCYRAIEHRKGVSI